MAERRGAIRDLPLEDDEGLLETTHLVLFPSGVIGAEFNSRGPRPGRLGGYLREKCPDLPRVKANALMNQDLLQQIERMTAFSAIEIKVTRSDLDIVEQARDPNGSLFSALRATGDSLGGETIHVTVSKTPRRPGSLLTSAMPRLRGLLGRDDVRHAASILKATGFDPDRGENVTVDLLRDRLISHATVARVGRNRVISTPQMYEEIINAYNQLRTEIDHAAEVAFG